MFHLKTLLQSVPAYVEYEVKSYPRLIFTAKDCTALAVNNCVKHDGTSYAVLKRGEVEF